MRTHTVIDGNAFYEIDDDCYEKLRRREEKQKEERKTGKAETASGQGRDIRKR